MQWSLSSENLDMAIICKEAADKLMKTESDKFENKGVLVKNSDVILVKNRPIKRIGVIQNRNYQRYLAQMYCPNKEIFPFIGTGIAYALESNKVDAVVIDAFKAIKLKGNKISTADRKEYDTYVLIVNKKFLGTKTYKEFVKLYNRSVEEINMDSIYRKEVESFLGRKISDSDWKEIKSWKIKFPQIEK